jgi:formylglycine-generating enzyme required for sulfatase activity/dienelactone hydrolase
MSDNRWQRVEDIFQRAVELAPKARSAFLDQACGEDQSLRREVESLLAYEKEEGSTFAKPAVEPSTQTLVAKSLSPGDKIGPYEIAGFIGAGGMGEVYRAYEPRLRRNVALKVLPAEASWDLTSRLRFEREAQAVAALNHPYIAAIYGLEESGGVSAIAMELVEGSTLAQRIARGRIPTQELLAMAKQMAEALEYAHEKGFIHRDLKPANIMVTGEGHVKLLDFGLARRVRLAQSETVTNPGRGEIAGTVGYMSPEQARGLPVDRRTDLFAFGVVLYEMVAGERPFTGNSTLAIIDATLHAQPREFADSLAPGKLRAIIWRLLEKDPANRYASAGEVLQELKGLETSLAAARPARLSRSAWIALWAAVVLAAVLAGWFWHRSSRERWALETATPEIARLVDAAEYVKAAALAREARSMLPKDPTLEKLWMRATGEVSIASVPSRADVSIRRYRGDPNAWETLGKTPLQKMRVPRDAYVWRLVKPGFAAVALIATPPGVPPPGAHSGFDLTLKLRPETSVPPEMVVVSGGAVGLGYPFGRAPAVRIDGFLIDRHEVTNEEYKKFVDAGGYQKREFWKQPFVRNGRSVAWEEAVAFFHDSTGCPGPATWEVGVFRKGRERHPVAGVSWYEAAAYAEFAGKSLPTAYHWTLASQATSYTPLIASGSNFRSDGTQPVGSDSAQSGFGTADMAGNVKEWCWNEARDANRLILGGGFGEQEYMFNHTDSQSPWDRRANFGFRCVKLDSPPTAAAAARIEVVTRDFRNEKAVADEVFKAYAALYAYDKGELNAQVEETAAMESWSRAKVTFDAAYGHERVPAYLFLPKNAPPPFQTVVYFPGGFAFSDHTLDLSSVEDAYDFLLKSGRALIVPIYKGTYERRDGFVVGRNPPAFQRDHVIAWAKDLGRSLDYLETRKDIDGTKVAYFGLSMGAFWGTLLPAVEKRIKTAILWSGGLEPTIHYLPEADPFNFVTHVTIPVLMLNARYDTFYPLESSQRPLFHFLGTAAKDKKHVIYDGGHGVFPRPGGTREILDWLDKYLGPVRH